MKTLSLLISILLGIAACGPQNVSKDDPQSKPVPGQVLSDTSNHAVASPGNGANPISNDPPNGAIDPIQNKQPHPNAAPDQAKIDSIKKAKAKDKYKVKGGGKEGER